MNNEHIEKSLNDIRQIFKDASEIIEALKPGEKITKTELVTTIAKKHNKTGPAIYSTLQFLFQNYPGVKNKAGVQGGIWKL